MALELWVNYDGAARSNPNGPASFGVWCQLSDGTFAWGLGDVVGVRTSCEAEFEALLAALDQCSQALVAFPAITAVRLRGDNKLTVNAMVSKAHVRADNLRPLFVEARRRADALGVTVRVGHVPRAHNDVADKLANRALDLKRRVTEADL